MRQVLLNQAFGSHIVFRSLVNSKHEEQIECRPRLGRRALNPEASEHFNHSPKQKSFCESQAPWSGSRNLAGSVTAGIAASGIVSTVISYRVSTLHRQGRGYLEF